MPYEKNIAALIGTDPPDTVKPIDHPTTKLDETADIRDILSGMVEKGYTDFSDPNAKSYFAGLAGIVGRQAAQQMATHIFLFNQRDDTKGKSPEAKISQFYSMGATDPEIDNIIKGAGSFGSGPVSGARNSSDLLSMQTVGKGFAKGNADAAISQRIKDTASTNIKSE